MSDYALGVDLGTTYSAAAVARRGTVEPLSLGSDGAAMPSVVVLRADGEVLVGDAAERRAATEPQRAAREFKRRLGDPVPIVVGGEPHTVESLMARLLADIVARATAQEGAPPSVVVLTHPANHAAFKTDLLRAAARLAGLAPERVRLLSEPEAAAIAYGRQQRIEAGAVVAVYDFGGGTFDAALVRRCDDHFELLGVPEGMERLGGIDIDQAVLAHVDAALGGAVAAADPRDPQTRPAQARLRVESRRAKEALSTDADTLVTVALPGVRAEVPLTRAELEAMVRPRVLETVRALERAVASAGIGLDQVARILLVGGTSRMPLVERCVAEATGRPVTRDAHPKLAIALGAAAAGAAALPDVDSAAMAWRPPDTPPPGPHGPRPAGPPARPRRGPSGAALAAAGVAVGVTALVIGLALRSRSSSGGGTQTSTAATVTTSATAGTAARPGTGSVTGFAFGGAAGSGIPGPARSAGVSAIDALAVARDGVLVAADATVLRITNDAVTVLARLDGRAGGLAVAPDGAVLVSTAAGVTRVDGRAPVAVLTADDGGLGSVAGPLATDAAGNLYVADNANHRVVRRGQDGAVSLVAGNGAMATPGGADPGGQRAETVALGTVTGLAVDGRGNLLIADDAALALRVVSRSGLMATLAGTGTAPTSNLAPDTPGRSLAFGGLNGLAVDARGRVYVSDGVGGAVVRIDPDGATTLVIARRAGAADPVDGVAPLDSSLRSPGALAVEPRTGTVYLADGVVVRQLDRIG